MVDPALTAEFPWLRTDPTPILGDARPRTTAELLEKPRIWMSLYREWMASAHPDQLAVLDRISRSETSLVEDAARLEPHYPAFYEAGGQLKDAARRDPADARQRFPWAPAEPKELLGEARPKDVASLVADGTGSPWAKVFEAWLAANPPFEDAAEVFRRVMSGTRGDQARLDPSVAGFAHVMGKVKDRLREKHGGAAERAMRRVGEAVAKKAEPVKQASPAKQASAAGPAPKPRPQTPAAAAPARPQVSPAQAAVQAQFQLAMPILQQTPSLSGWVDYAAQRFTEFGGTLAEEAANLSGYRALIDSDTAYLTEQLTAMGSLFGAGTDEALYGGLSLLRNAVYRVAWNIDLSYQNYYGGWPHQRISYIVAELHSSASPQLLFDGGRALHPLVSTLDSVYDAALAILDVALQVIVSRPQGYTYEDGAEIWSVHELMRAKAELSGLVQTVATWSTASPTEQEDEATLDHATSQTFGVPYQNLLQLAG